MAPSEDDESNRLALLHAMVDRTGGQTNTAVDLIDLGPSIGLSLQATSAAHRWLKEQGLVRDLANGMERVALTAEGVRRDEVAISEPDQPTPGMPPANTVTNITVQGSVYGGLQQGSGGALLSQGRPSSDDGWWTPIRVALIGGTIATLIGTLLAISLLGDDDDGSGAQSSTTTATTGGAVPVNGIDDDVSVSCAEGPCIELRIVNTLEAGDDTGVYVRSTPFEEADRLTGVFADTVIYGVCLLADGFEAVPGERRWAKAPFDFVPGDVATDGSFSDPQSRPSRTSTDYGWITADSIGPADLLAELPPCEE